MSQPPPPPLTPRPKLFLFLLIFFIVWVIVLLTMYFRTVYPQRHATTQAAASISRDAT